LLPYSQNLMTKVKIVIEIDREEEEEDFEKRGHALANQLGFRFQKRNYEKVQVSEGEDCSIHQTSK